MRNEHWWQDAVIYQIYPRSFCDANGDGIGDIPGIISKLDYLQSLGVGAIWLSPVYLSPDADNGYDIADYRSIDPKFGTLDDFDRLVLEAGRRGIKIIMDLVINHTSIEHEWFQKSRKRVKGYEDYYIWRNKPNNWGGFFGGGTWDYDPVRKQWYLHLFAKEQPDLNWHCPAVMAEVQEILRFWLRRGVAGFRCDVINVLWKNTLENGKKKPILTGLEHYHSTEGCHAILRTLQREVFAEYDAFTVGETVFVTPQQGRELCEDYRKELSEIFSFEHMETDQVLVKWFKTKFCPEKFYEVLTKWQKGITWNSLYFENHDQPRSVSRFGDDREEYHDRSAKALATLLLTLRGTPFIYEGQELGMTNFDFTSMDEVQDVESKNIWKIARKLGIPEKKRWQMIAATSRDNARTPMQWSEEVNGGFTTGTPWLGVNKNYVNLNAAAQESDPASVLNWYRMLIALREENDALRCGSFEALEIGKQVFAFRRSAGEEHTVTVVNLSGKPAKSGCRGAVLADNCGKNYFDGALAPWQAVILKEQ